MHVWGQHPSLLPLNTIMEYYLNRLSSRMQLIERLTGEYHPLETAVPSVKQYTDEQTENMNILFNSLEKKLYTEMKHQIDISFLELYIKERLIPRGLRVNLQPTFNNDVDFSAAWYSILDECSLKLMHLITTKRSKLCTEVNNEIRETMVSLNDYTDHDLYHSSNHKITTSAQKNEFDLINKKRTKLNRDRSDKQTQQYRCRSNYTNTSNNNRKYDSNIHLPQTANRPQRRESSIRPLMDIKVPPPRPNTWQKRSTYINKKYLKPNPPTLTINNHWRIHK